MKQAADTLTPELPGIPAHKKRGRPTTGKAMSAAERMRRYREGLKAAEPNQRMMDRAIEELFRRLEHTPIADHYHQLRGAIMALEWANMVNQEEAERAREWAFCVWRHNGFKRG